MKKPSQQNDLRRISNFLFEVGILAKTPRSFSSFLGSGSQSVAEHINRTAFIGFVLSHMTNKANTDRIISMCLFHDITEARISDLNYVHQKYNERLEAAALKDLTDSMPYGNFIKKIIEEYEERKTLESKLAKDADNLELLLTLKEQADAGNKRALTWIPPLIKRLATKEGKKLASSIMKTNSDEWWYGDKKDSWWVNRNDKK